LACYINPAKASQTDAAQELGTIEEMRHSRSKPGKHHQNKAKRKNAIKQEKMLLIVDILYSCMCNIVYLLCSYFFQLLGYHSSLAGDRDLGIMGSLKSRIE